MKLYFSLFLVMLFSLLTVYSCAQQNSLTFGLNVTHFSDWKHRPLNFFNPELSYSKRIADKYTISNTVSAFWGKAKSEDIKTEGAIFNRLIFSNDITINYFIKSFFFSAGPSVRYRNEKKILYFYPSSNPFEFVIDPDKAHFDFGAAFKTGYNLSISKKSFFVLKLSYRFYNKGIDPVSFGVSYGWTWE